MSKSFTKTLKALFASSRPIQSTLSISQPLFGAFLAVGAVPSPELMILLVIGSAAGLYAVFSINDLLDYNLDRQMVARRKQVGFDLDSVLARHPLTAGLVTTNEQIAWIIAMGIIAIIILLSLSTTALALFFLAILLEALYCRLALVTEYKFAFAGAVVAVGVMIGWFAAGGGFAAIPLLLLSGLFFAWEVGGRNIPNDLSDVEQDKLLGVRTLPSVYGEKTSSLLIALFGFAVLIANIALGVLLSLGMPYLVLSTLAGIAFLILPALFLMANPLPKEALKYFNKASIYPFFLLALLAFVYGINAP
ncbi:MAG: UbiA prenyltransferase family protein [Candidatus Micrarchaeota archaeon]